MKRRTLDIILSAGGIVGAILVLVLGLILQGQANYAKDYTADQLGAQNVFFTPADKLNGEDKAEGGQCLADNGGQQLLTGKQAECYANQYIAYHMREQGKAAGYEGATFASLGSVVRGELPAAVEAAQKALDDAKAAGTTDTTQLEADLAAAQAKLGEIAGLRNTLFQGETLRGLLLTVYGFSVFGELAGTAALVCFLAAGVLFLISIAGFIHAFTTPKEAKVFAA